MAIVEQVAARQLALGWLLHHAPNIVPVPGTGSAAHPEENVRAASLQLTARDMQELAALK